jgi:hypothetical protein
MGTAFDNAGIDSFFGTLKAEFFRLAQFCNLDNLKTWHARLHSLARP